MIYFNLKLSLNYLFIFTACGINDPNADTCVADDGELIPELATCKPGFALQPNKAKCVGKFILCLCIDMVFHELNCFVLLPSPSKLYYFSLRK